MRAVHIPKFGGPDVLEVREFPDPTPKAGEVRIRVRAAGLNFADIMARKGLYPDAGRPPYVVGYEVAGEVDALGEGVTTPAVGTKVIGLTRFWGQAELVSVPAALALPMPEGMSFEAAAAIPVNYLTAHHMLFHVGHLKPGESVLVHGAAGGVGLAVAQLCRTVARVTVLGTASASKHDVARENGCTHPIDYRTHDYAEEARRLTNGRGVDLVLDPLGGGDWRKGYRLLAPAGRLIAYGFSNLSSDGARSIFKVGREFVKVPLFNPVSLMNANKAVAGVNMGHLWSETGLLMPQMERLVALWKEGVVRPHVDRSFAFDRAADAHRYIEARQNVGKVLLVP